MAGDTGHTAHAPFTSRALEIIRAIPRGKVSSYGQVAAMAGHPGSARQVVRILHTLSDSAHLPWHRVINILGGISLPEGGGFELQKRLLESEGVKVSKDGRIDLDRHAWSPR